MVKFDPRAAEPQIGVCTCAISSPRDFPRR